MKDEEVKEIIQSILNCEPEEFYKKYKKMKKAEEEFNKLFEPFKKGLIQLHSEHNDLPNTIIVGGAKLTYVSPSTRTSIDSKKLKEEEPEIAKKFTKSTLVSASVRIEGGIVMDRKEYQKDYYKRNKEKRRDYFKKYYEENKDRIKERHQKYHEENKEASAISYEKYYKEHKEERKEYYKEHYEKNKKARQKYYREYYAKKKAEKEAQDEDNSI